MLLLLPPCRWFLPWCAAAQQQRHGRDAQRNITDLQVRCPKLLGSFARRLLTAERHRAL
jgi:hypothetical protein